MVVVRCGWWVVGGGLCVVGGGLWGVRVREVRKD